jgi:flagellar hook-length control protein FliK
VFIDVLRLLNVDPESPTRPGGSGDDAGAEGEETATDVPNGLNPEGWVMSLASGSVAVPGMRQGMDLPHDSAALGSANPAVAGIGLALDALAARLPAGAEPATRADRADGMSLAAPFVTTRMPANMGGEAATTIIERRTAELTPGVAAATHVPAPTVSEPASHADGVLRLVAQAPGQWRQPLTEALGERLTLQMARGSEHAVIRLDPPTLGRIEILVRHEGGSVHVQLSASHGEVMRQLSQVGDSLRQDLMSRHAGEVSVVVHDGSRDAAGRERSHTQAQRDTEEPGPGRALAEADEGLAASAFALSQDRE